MAYPAIPYRLVLLRRVKAITGVAAVEIGLDARANSSEHCDGHDSQAGTAQPVMLGCPQLEAAGGGTTVEVAVRTVVMARFLVGRFPQIRAILGRRLTLLLRLEPGPTEVAVQDPRIVGSGLGIQLLLPCSRPVVDYAWTSRQRREGLGMAGVPAVRVRRAYDPPEADDGQRVLVDRLWPRGLSKQRARLDEWCKDVAPSTELREWYGHDPDRFAEFTRRYRIELGHPEHAAALARLRDSAARGPLTLLTAAKRSDISEATVLADLLTPAAPR